MALERAVASVPLGVGIDTKSDPKTIEPGTLRRMLNGRIDMTGSVRRRYGSKLLSAGVVYPNQKLVTVGDRLVRLNGSESHTYDELGEQWLDVKSQLGPTIIAQGVSEQIPLLRTSLSRGITPTVPFLTQYSLGYAQGYFVATYQTSDPTDASARELRYVIRDARTGVLVKDNLIDNDPVTPFASPVRVFTMGAPDSSESRVVVIFSGDAGHGSGMNAAFINPTASSPIVIFPIANTFLGSPFVMDAALPGVDAAYWGEHQSLGHLNVLLGRRPAGDGIILLFNAQGVIQVTSDTASLTVPASSSYGLVVGGNSDIYAAYQSGSNVECRIYNGTLTSQLGLGVLGTVAGFPRPIAGTVSRAGTRAVFAWSSGSGDANDTYARQIASSGAVSGGNPTRMRGVTLAAKPFELADERVFVPCIHSMREQELGAQGVLANGPIGGDPVGGNIASRHLVGRTSLRGFVVGGDVRLHYSDTVEIDGKFYYVELSKNGVIQVGDNIRDMEEAALVEHDFGACGNAVEFAGSAFLASGLLWEHDGRYWSEAGFLHRPSFIGSPVGTSDGSMSNGSYIFRAVYMWRDAHGRVHRSAPSDPFSTTVTGATDDRKLTFDVAPYRISGKADVYIELYRTLDGGTTFHMCGLAENNRDATEVEIESSIDDDDLAERPILYTTGGALDHIAPEHPRHVVVHDNRLFVMTGDDEIRYSKQPGEADGVAFNDALRLPLDPSGGRLSTLASQDGQLLVFRENSIWRFMGGFIGNAGTGFIQDPQNLNADIGNEFLSPIVVAKDGVYFKSPRGWWLLTRQLQPVYIGAGAEKYNGIRVLDARILEDVNEIRWHLEGNEDFKNLVFDTYRRQWLTDSFPVFTPIASSVSWQGRHTFINNGGSVFVEDKTNYADHLTTYPMEMETPWLKVGGLQGFQRVWWVHLVGEFRDDHTLRVEIFYDYENSGPQIYERDLAGGAPGEPYIPYLVRIKPRRQKCVAMKLVIKDLPIPGHGEGARFNEVRLEVGLKRKLASGKTLQL